MGARHAHIVTHVKICVHLPHPLFHVMIYTLKKNEILCYVLNTIIRVIINVG